MRKLSRLQTWVALPKGQEEAPPTFGHLAKAELPTIAGDGVTVRLVVGSLFGKRAPTPAFSEMFYAEEFIPLPD